MSVDLNAFLAGLVADVNAEIEQVEADPLAAFDDALDTYNEARADLDAWNTETDAARRQVKVLLGNDCRYTANYADYLTKVTEAWDKGERRLNMGWQGNGPINEKVLPWGRTLIAHTRKISDAREALATVRKSVDHADLPVGTLVKFDTKVGNDLFQQVGFIQKVTDASYVVSLESWHPIHNQIYTNDSLTARISRSDGTKDMRYGATGARSLELLASPERANEIRARVLAWREAKAAAEAYERQVVADHNLAYAAYNQQAQAQSQWDQEYRSVTSTSWSEAERQVLEKYAAEVAALSTTFSVRKREVLGTRPEVTARKVNSVYYFRDAATPEQIAESHRLSAVATRLEKRVRG